MTHGKKCININYFMFNTLLFLLLIYNNKNGYLFLSKNKFNIISFYFQKSIEIIYYTIKK